MQYFSIKILINHYYYRFHVNFNVKMIISPIFLLHDHDDCQLQSFL